MRIDGRRRVRLVQRLIDKGHLGLRLLTVRVGDVGHVFLCGCEIVRMIIIVGSQTIVITSEAESPPTPTDQAGTDQHDQTQG